MHLAADDTEVQAMHTSNYVCIHAWKL